MKTEDMAKALKTLAKRGLFVHWQDSELIEAAARQIEEDASVNGDLRQEIERQRLDIEKLTAECTELRYLISEREGIQEGDAILDAAAPGEAATDLWDDGFWDEDNCE